MQVKHTPDGRIIEDVADAVRRIRFWLWLAYIALTTGRK